MHVGIGTSALTVVAAGVLAVIPLAYWPALFAPAATPRWAIVGIAGPLLLAIRVLAAAWRGRSTAVTHTTVWVAAVGLLAVHFASVAWTPDRPGAHLWNSALLALLCWLAFIATTVRTSRQAVTLLAAAAGGGVLAGIVGVLQQLDRPPALFSQTLVPGSTFVYANVAAQFFAPLVPLLLVMVVRATRVISLLAWTAALLIAGSYLELTRCRGAWLATALTIVALSGVIAAVRGLRRDLWQRCTRAKAGLALLGVVGLVIALVLIPHEGAFKRRGSWSEMWRSFLEPVQVVTGAGGEVARSSAAMRWRMLGCAGRALGAHGLLGLGSDGFRAGIIPYLDQATASLCHTPTTQMLTLHCDPVQLLLETGALGGLAALGLGLGVLAIGWRLVTRSADDDVRWLGLGCLSGLVALGLHSLVDFPLHMPTSSFLAATLAGLVLGLSRGALADRPRFELRGRSPLLVFAAIALTAAGANIWRYTGYVRAMWHLNVAWAAKNAGVGEVALREIDGARAACDLPALVRREHGVIHARFNRDRPAALRAVHRALADDPGWINNLVNAAGIEMELGLLADARAHLGQALAVNDELHLAHYGLGQIAQAEGRATEARAAFARCVQLQPDFEPARRQLEVLGRGP